MAVPCNHAAGVPQVGEVNIGLIAIHKRVIGRWVPPNRLSDPEYICIGQRRLAPAFVLDAKGGFDGLRAHAAAPHRPGDARQGAVTLPFRDRRPEWLSNSLWLAIRGRRFG